MGKIIEAVFGLTKSNLVQGIEAELRQRKRTEQLSIFAVAAIAGLQAWFADTGLEEIGTHLSNFAFFIESALAEGFATATSKYPPAYGTALAAFLILLLIGYILLKRTRFLFHYAEEPFRYTFWIDEFKPIQQDSKDKNNANIETAELDYFVLLLRHDLIGALNSKIRRLSLLDSTKLETADQSSLDSHIFIEGTYAIRQAKNAEGDNQSGTVLEIMPRVRIGPKGKPSHIAATVQIPLAADDKIKSGDLLDQENQQHEVEKLFSNISTEIYRQIELDLEQKLDLFPSKYMRAIGLFHEASDFAQSNTLNAYDQAIKHYQRAREYFDVSLRMCFNNFLTAIPLFNWGIEYRHFWAQTEIGYAKCLIYRRLVSAYTGRNRNPVFTIPHDLERVRSMLAAMHGKFSAWQSAQDFRKPLSKLDRDAEKREKSSRRNRFLLTISYLTFPRDQWKYSSWLVFRRKPAYQLFEKQKQILFEAFVVLALAYRSLGAFKRAQEALNDARATAPAFSENNALFLIASAMIETRLERQIQLAERATSLANDFEIAFYQMSKYLERQFRQDDYYVLEPAKPALDGYGKVLNINPGNVAAAAGKGYIYWLIGDLDNSDKCYRRGREVKAFVSQTFVGEMGYGLARIVAERGEYNSAFRLFSDAISSDPDLCANVTRPTARRTTAPFDYVGPNMLLRFEAYKDSSQLPMFEYLSPVYAGDIVDWSGLTGSLKSQGNPLTSFIYKNLRANIRNDLDNLKNKSRLKKALQMDLLAEINRIFRFRSLYPEKILPADCDWPAELTILTRYPDKKLAKVEIAYRNRMICDQYLHRQIRRTWDMDREIPGDSDASDRFNHLSVRTLSSVRSFVLVDYANACYAYFLRFGDHKQLESAQRFYELAIERMPENKVAHFNLGNALSQSIGHETGALRQFSYAAELDPQWQLAVISKGQARIESHGKQIKRASNRGDFLNRSRPLKRIEHGVSDLQPYSLGTTTTTESELNSLNRILTSEVRKILEATRLFAIVEGMATEGDEMHQDHTFELATKLLPSIETDRLNELDVDALSIWMSMLATRYHDDDYFELAETIGQQILERYYADNFGINRRLREMYQWRKKLIMQREQSKSSQNPSGMRYRLSRILKTGPSHSISALEKKISACESTMLNVVEHSLMQKKADYLPLTWLPELYKEQWEDKYTPYLAGADKIRLAAYHNLNADFLYVGINPPPRLDQESRFREAINASSEAIKYEPGAARYRFRRGESYYDMRDYQRALTDFERASEIAPRNSYYLWYQGNVFKKLGEYEKALQLYEMAISVDDHYPHYFWDYGGILRSLKKWDEAESAYKRALELDKDQGHYHNMLGNIKFENAIELREQGREDEARDKFAEARNHYQEAHKIHNALGNYCYYVGLAEIELGNFSSAIESLNNAIERYEGNVEYYRTLAKAHKLMGNSIEAESVLEHARQVWPDNPSVLNELGIIHFENVRYHEAAELFSQAASLAPDNAIIFSNAGAAYYNLGEWEYAVDAYSSAYEYAAEIDKPIIAASRAACYREAKQFEQALEWYEEASKLKKDEPSAYLEDIEAMREKLSQSQAPQLH